MFLPFSVMSPPEAISIDAADVLTVIGLSSVVSRSILSPLISDVARLDFSASSIVSSPLLPPSTNDEKVSLPGGERACHHTSAAEDSRRRRRRLVLAVPQPAQHEGPADVAVLESDQDFVVDFGQDVQASRRTAARGDEACPGRLVLVGQVREAHLHAAEGPVGSPGVVVVRDDADRQTIGETRTVAAHGSAAAQQTGDRLVIGSARHEAGDERLAVAEHMLRLGDVVVAVPLRVHALDLDDGSRPHGDGQIALAAGAHQGRSHPRRDTRSPPRWRPRGSSPHAVATTWPRPSGASTFWVIVGVEGAPAFTPLAA